MALVVPSRSANATFALRHVSVSEESDHREEPQQRRGGPLDRPFRPMPLGFEPEALAGLLECGLHLPAFHEPRDHPLRIGIEDILKVSREARLEASLLVPEIRRLLKDA